MRSPDGRRAGSARQWAATLVVGKWPCSRFPYRRGEKSQDGGHGVTQQQWGLTEEYMGAQPNFGALVGTC